MRTTALLLFLNDIAGISDDAYTAWHRDHHVPQRLTVPGILSAHRYERRAGRGRRFLTAYELAATEALAHPSYLDLIERPDRPTAAMRAHLQGGIRIVVTLDHALAGPPPQRLQVQATAGDGIVWASGPCEQPPSRHPLAVPAALPDRISLVSTDRDRPSTGGDAEAVWLPWTGAYSWLDTRPAPP